jgi:dihydroorotate dehydrogenase
MAASFRLMPTSRLAYTKDPSTLTQLWQSSPSRRTFISTGSFRPTTRNLHNPLLSEKGRPRSFRRYASTEIAGDARSVATRTKNLLLGTALGLFLTAGYFYITDTRAGVHRWLVVPLLRFAYPDGEDAHRFGNAALRTLFDFGIEIRERGDSDATGDLETAVFGHVLANPIGLSAGIDKHAEIPWPLFALSPSIVEIGGATPYPQDGNPRPRVFRVPSQNALINRYGLNSEGADFIAMRLRQRVRKFAYSRGFGIDEAAEKFVLNGMAGVPPGSLTKGKLLAVQIAKNKFTPNNDIEAVKRDYVYCAETLAKYADCLTINVSSPNSIGLRSLQQVRPLTQILSSVVEAVQRVDRKDPPKVLVKVSPDEDSDADIIGCCEAVLRSGAAGIVVGNTTTRFPKLGGNSTELSSAEASAMKEQGGFSGPHLFERTVDLVKRYRYYLDKGAEHASEAGDEANETPKVIFATGGITNGKQALEVLKAGANVAMVYTAMGMSLQSKLIKS